MSGGLTADALREGLRTRVIGREIRCVDRCESTNDLAWSAALEGAPEGLVILAEEQTKGRGRFGRTWIAGRGEAVLASVLLRPSIELDRIPLMTALGALAAADVAGPEAQIRFPNDVLVGGRKIAGILVEGRFVSSRPDAFIVGLGFNVTGHPPDVNATSLGPGASRLHAARALLEALDLWYARLGGALTEFRTSWRARSYILRKRVRIRSDGREFSAVVEEVDPVDGLVVRLDSGHPLTVRSEHVEHLAVD